MSYFFCRMNKGEPNKNSGFNDEYDDGVVCFGPLTESQLDRHNKLPRRTVVPSDFKLR